MKKLIFILPIFVLASCNDALVEKPKSLAVETFYNTAMEVESAVNAIYEPLRSTNCLGGLYPAQMEAYTDYSYGRGSYAILSEFQGLDPTNITRTGQMWDQFYLSIRNANLVITNAPKGSRISQADVEKYIGEAKFLRALAYFYLVRNYGGVILRTEDNMTEQSLPRSTVEEIYQLILTDLAGAESTLPDAPAIAGRPSRWAAKSLLADVHFYRGEYEQARSKASEVIGAGKYSLVPVTVADDFDRVFGPEVASSPEEIFYLKYTRQAGFGFQLPMFAHHPGSQLHGAGGYYAHYTDAQSNKVFREWSDDDLRKSYNWYSYNIGLGANSYLCKKYTDRQALGASGAGNDSPLYKYSDILLLYAEADSYVNNGPTADGLEKLNMVHRRAYGKDPLTPSDVDFKLEDYSAQTFPDLVLAERGFETQYEGKRWLDLKRTGKVKEIIKAAVGKDVGDKHLLWPIPLSELNFNTVLEPTRDQNPGY